jgi:broad specificity phosphatase PhoE
VNRSPDLYVRHAMAEKVDGVPPHDWRLGPNGQTAAAALAGWLRLPDPPTLVVTSPEPKAAETAAPIADRFGVPLVLDERLREVERPWIGDGYRLAVRSYLRGEELEGWEDRMAVARRISKAVADAKAHVDEAPVAVVGHGLSLSLHVAAEMPPGFLAGQFWSRLAFPDAWLLDLDRQLLHHLVPVG